MLRRIEAEERLAAITDGATAAATMQETARTKHVARLERAASGAPGAKPVRASVASLAGMGVGLRIEEPAAPSAANERAVNDG